jgi:excisionase family DNA binding protein
LSERRTEKRGQDRQRHSPIWRSTSRSECRKRRGSIGQGRLPVSERLLTTREVAAFLGVSPETVLRRWRAGELPGYRLASNALRFRESEIEAWLEGTRLEGVGDEQRKASLGRAGI